MLPKLQQACGQQGDAGAALGLRADLDGSRAALVSAPEEPPLARLHYELPQLQIFDGGSCLICLDSWHLHHAWRLVSIE